MNNQSLYLNLRIAPKASCGYWTFGDWENARRANDWAQMIQIFSDRIQFRFLDVINTIIRSDLTCPNRRYGFAVMALDCLLVETLHQFYSGKKQSPQGRSNIRRNGGPVTSINELGQNGQFYAKFFTEVSFKFPHFFKDKEIAAVLFFQDIRCGLLHAGETSGKSMIRTHSVGDKNIELFSLIDNDTGVLIFRDTFHKILEDEVKEYLYQLTIPDKKELRKNFIRKMGFVCNTDYGDGDIE